MANEMKELWDLLNLLAEKEEAEMKSSPEPDVKGPVKLNEIKEPQKTEKELPAEMKQAINAGRARAAYFAALYKTLISLEIPDDVTYDLAIADARK